MNVDIVASAYIWTIILSGILGSVFYNEVGAEDRLHGAFIGVLIWVVAPIALLSVCSIVFLAIKPFIM